MNKTELIEKVAEKANLTKAQAKSAVEAFGTTVKEALVAGDKVQLIGFGTFSVNERPAREGINPATKEKITIAAKKVAKFKAGAEVTDALNYFRADKETLGNTHGLRVPPFFVCAVRGTYFNRYEIY